MSKIDRRKRLKAKRALAEAMPALNVKTPKKPERDSKGRFSIDGDPQKTALEARGRQLGTPYSRNNKKALSDPLCGSQMGRVILAETKAPETLTLWQTWMELCTAMARYRRAIDAPQPHAKTAKYATGENGYSVSLKDPEAVDRSAINAHAIWMARLDAIPLVSKALLLAAESGQNGALWQDGKATPRGLATLTALKQLAEAE